VDLISNLKKGKAMLKKLFYTSLVIVVVVYFFFFNSQWFSKKNYIISPYPDGKNFAFTITDDPDGATLEKIQPLYELLKKLNYRTTVAVWVYKPQAIEKLPDPEEQKSSDTLEDRNYLEFVKDLNKSGFEIALHTVTAGHDERNLTIQGYERFKEIFGYYPKINIMHSKNKENIYWGSNVFKNFLMKFLVDRYTDTKFQGENSNSMYFWGDICQAKTKYVRLWGTSDINTLKYNPDMPYFDPNKPFVNYWFSFSDGYNKKFFKRLLSDKNIAKLVKERGACVVYTHFASGFTRKQKDGSYSVDEDVNAQLLRLSKQKDGWFVPASTLLDRLLAMKNVGFIEKQNAVIIFNSNDFDVPGVTLITKPNAIFYGPYDMQYRANSEGKIIIENIKGNGVTTLFKSGDFMFIKNPEPSFFESVQLIIGRLKIMVFSHRG
jgi:hypothetical protein